MLEAVRVAVGASTFDTAWNDGWELSIPECVEVASTSLVAAMETDPAEVQGRGLGSFAYTLRTRCAWTATPVVDNFRQGGGRRW